MILNKLNEQDYIGPVELANMAGVSLNMAYRWLYLKKLPAFKVMGRWAIQRRDAWAFVQKRNQRKQGM
jgi:predicted site-specific integrase-resolvase